MKKGFLIIIYCLMLLSKSFAQDIHFTQFYNVPTLLNPAQVGFVKNQFNANIIYRNQWASIINAYKTFGAGFDMPIYNLPKLKNSWLGFGVQIVNDRAGSQNFTSNSGRINSALHFKPKEKLQLSLGLGLGFAQRSINTVGLLFGDQINSDLSTNSSSTDVIENSSFNNFDSDLGLWTQYFLNKKIIINSGFSVFHIARTKNSFLYNFKLPLRYAYVLKLKYNINKQYGLEPNALWMYQHKMYQFNLGTNLFYKSNQNYFLTGLSYRLKDAIICYLGYRNDKYDFGLSYDFNTSSIKNNISRTGAFEMSFAYKGLVGMETPKDIVKPVKKDSIIPKISKPIIVNVKGKILDKQTNSELEPGPDVYLYLKTNGQYILIDSQKLANSPYNFKLKPCSNYKIKAVKDGYLSNVLNFATDCNALTDINMQNDNLYLEKIVTNKVYTLKNIYYEFDKADITIESEKELDNLIELLNNNPNIAIELGSHTDSKGDDQYNLDLSQKRAEACVNYLIKNGINTKRLIAKGYGEALPVALNSNADGSDNPDGRAMNRRTEFKVIGILKDGVLIQK